MRSLPRDIDATRRRAARDFPAVVVTGPRRAGKTFCLRRAFPAASYQLFEDPDVVARFRADPRGFLDALSLPAILDEVQNVPELFAYVRARIDATPRARGRWLLTGSQDFALMQGASESMAGRAAVLHLLPFSASETRDCDPFLGGFPEVRARPKSVDLWMASYVQTYLERDVRAVTQVRDLGTFRRFLSLVATRSGSVLNRTDFAAPLGVSVPTISQWISVLETTGILLVVPPYFDNLGKRLVKSPKIYFTDTGLLCHLLGVRTRAELERSPHVGAVFETFVASELVKERLHAGRSRELYFFRDDEGLEVDFVRPRDGGGVELIEAKWTRTPRPDDARSLLKVRARFATTAPVDAILVHRGGGTAPAQSSLAPGVSARTVERFFVRAPARPSNVSARSRRARPPPSRRTRPPSGR